LAQEDDYFATGADMTRQHVLISGASIAGPALAYWLHQYGFDVTVVERSATVRSGGYPIDLRGTAMDACQRMGIADEMAAANINTERLNFVDEGGKVVASVRPESITGGIEGRDVEVPREIVTRTLWEHTRDDVEYIFNDSIESLTDDGKGVDIAFRSGRKGRYAYVIGADGLHSNVRRLVFGDESQFERYVGRYFVGFICDNELGMSREAMSLQLPSGRQVIQYAVGEQPPSVHAFFSFTCPEPPPLNERTLQSQRRLFYEQFKDVGWQAPRMLQALMKDDEAFYDTVSQIHMPTWSKGRVSLVGDAGYAASFLTGQGTSLAIVGAYVLAGELATSPDDPALAFERYERVMRPFVAANQGILKYGQKKLGDMSALKLKVRNVLLGIVFPVLDRLKLGRYLGRKIRLATTAIQLPDYSSAAVT
jgi:2-polyprenyl-6-methoxyphenol hydroxylase-like FAD-dependent oxidoreductase